jgi:hypothetical protein
MQVKVDLGGMDRIGVGDFDDEFGQSGGSLWTDIHIHEVIQEGEQTNLPSLGRWWLKKVSIINGFQCSDFELLEFFRCFHCESGLKARQKNALHVGNARCV